MNLVCYKPELEAEIKRLEKNLKKAKSTTEKQLVVKQKIADRLDYFRRYTMSISDFAAYLQKRFG